MKSNREELQEVEKRLKHEKERRMFERYQTIRLYMMGHTVKQITTIGQHCHDPRQCTYPSCKIT